MALLVSCTESVKNAEKVERLPDIYPDYIGVTIPAGIAPMDFNVEENDCVKVDVIAKGSKARFTYKANGRNGTLTNGTNSPDRTSEAVSTLPLGSRQKTDNGRNTAHSRCT